MDVITLPPVGSGENKTGSTYKPPSSFMARQKAALVLCFSPVSSRPRAAAPVVTPHAGASGSRPSPEVAVAGDPAVKSGTLEQARWQD